MSQKLSESLKDAIRRAFDQVDQERRGELTRAEVREVLQLIGQNPTKADMDAFFRDIDADTVDRDTIADFIEENVPLKSQAKINDEIAEAFAKFEASDEYVVTKADFREILTKLGDEPLTNDEADAIFEHMDKDSEHVKIADLSKLLNG